MRQLSFLPAIGISRSLAHGGSLRNGKRKIARPLDPKRPIHIVLRSSSARGAASMLTRGNRQIVENAISNCTKKYAIYVHRFANVGNHLHLVVSIPKSTPGQACRKPIMAPRRTLARNRFSHFLRELSGVIALKISGAKKGKSVRFWDELAYTRILTWGREIKTVIRYVEKNLMEATGSWEGWDCLKRGWVPAG